MGKNKPLPEREYLITIFNYNSIKGCLYWKQRDDQRPQWNARYAGKIAGYTYKNNSGKTYIAILVDGVKYLAHRLIWKMLNNYEPDEIDHIDGDGKNNKESNLRARDCVSNQRNKRLSVNNTSGCQGVSRRSGRNKWRADIKVGGKSIFIGSFNTFDEAVSARKLAEDYYVFHDEHGTKRDL